MENNLVIREAIIKTMLRFCVTQINISVIGKTKTKQKALARTREGRHHAYTHTF